MKFNSFKEYGLSSFKLDIASQTKWLSSFWWRNITCYNCVAFPYNLVTLLIHHIGSKRIITHWDVISSTSVS